MTRPAKIFFLLLIIAFAVFCKKSEASYIVGDRPNEVVFLQTDRDIYIAGEHLFFSVELINFPKTDEALSEIVYLALRNQFGVIERINLNLSQNRFSGSLYLPDTLSTGYLELIGFTNWMRNYDESCFFKKTILVVNRFDTELNVLKESLNIEDQAELAFFAEGGHLIAGMEQKLLVTTMPGHILPNARINIFSEGGDSIQIFSLNEMGWATFDWMPSEGQKYYASINENDKRFYLPEPEHSGHMLQISQVNSNLRVAMAANIPSEQKLNLVINRNGKVYREYPVTLSSTKPVSQEILATDLDQGLYVFRLMDGEGRILSARDWYIDKRTVNNARVSLNKSEFGAREKVELIIQLEDPEDAIDWVTVSVSPDAGRMPQRIHYPLFLTATDLIQGRGVFPNEVLRYLGNLGQEDINDLLIKPLPPVGSPVSNLANPFRYYRETSHLTLTGRITEASSGYPSGGARIILNAPDTIVNLLYAYANEDGLFTFFLDSYYDDREIFLTPEPVSVTGEVRIEVFDKFDYKAPFSPEPFYLPDSYREAIIESQKIMEINKAFGIPTPSETTDIKNQAEPVRVFSQAVYSIDTDDFIPLDNLQEIAREIIGPWRIRRTRTGTTHTLISQTTSNAINGTPVLFIDGIFTANIEPLLPLSSRHINSIQILNLEWKHGDMHFPGIVAVFTKNEEFRNLELQPAPVRVFNTAHQFPSKLISPVYYKNFKQHSQPDLRQLLFWFSGELEINSNRAEFSWYTGDLPVDYTICLEGKTRKGKLLTFEIPLLYEN